jgi:hypothetical protein
MKFLITATISCYHKSSNFKKQLKNFWLRYK